MEGYVLIILLVIGIPLMAGIWLVVRAVSARGSIEEIRQRLYVLESEVLRLQSDPQTRSRRESSAQEMPEIPLAAQPLPATPIVRPKEPGGPMPLPLLPKPVAANPIVPPPVISEKPEPSLPSFPPGRLVPAINWEQFMGVKLFAWIGGLALFLGVCFFVKYSFDNNLVPPELRVALGFISGLGLLGGGVVMSRKDYLALSQTLCATGIVILYAVTFACRSIYHFQFFGPAPTFLLMGLLTATAFLLAVRLDALVVAILGMLGGFLTPILLSTGQDNPSGLFGYIAILDAGLILVALQRRWLFLVALAAVGTVFTQIGWLNKFFSVERYFEGNKILIALAILLGFNALYLAAAWWAKRRAQLDWWLAGATFGLAAAALAFTAWFLTFPPLAQRPWLMFSFVFLIDLAVVALVLLENKNAPAQPIGGLAVFCLLALWTTNSLTNESLNAALTFYFVFAIVHSVFPVTLQRRRGPTAPLWGAQLFPPLALVLMLIPIFRLTAISFIIWPFVLLVDVLAIGLAVLTASLLAVLAVLLLTLAATGALIFKVPSTLTGLPTSFFLVGAFAVFFVVAGVWLTRRFKPEALRGGSKLGDALALPENLAVQLPALSVILPFLLLIMATLRLPLSNPSPLFGLALLLVVLLLAVTRLFSFDWLPAIGLACVAALECAWHFNHFDPADALISLTWYLAFLVVFAIFPFLFLRQFKDRVIPWAAAAMAGPPQFFLVHKLVKTAYPNDFMGLLPAVFAIPPLLSLLLVLKKNAVANAARMTQLAWFAGVSLFFITLVFPIQFERQWITISWALEGAALLWLFHRIAHPGLRLVGVGLLAAAFVRLALNPAVLEYHLRSAMPILNWYFYSYGIVTACLLTGASLLKPPRHEVLGINARPILVSLAIVLAFLLLNIEIADYFSPPESTLTFQFSGNFARDMTYSIAWALFALGLLVAGISRKVRALRYAGLGLLSVTLLKLFLHDLAQLGQLYRIGAFIGVAVIAMLASFAYQRFFAATVTEKPRVQGTNL